MTAEFTPTPWLTNKHAQTLWGAIVPASCPPLHDINLDLPDGDVVGLKCTGPIADRPALIIMHGLEGSVRSPYVGHLLSMAQQLGFCGILLQARGAARRANKYARNYHSGDWEDADSLARYLRKHGATKVAAAGISLGGNQLLKWLGETGDECLLDAAIAVSVPFDLAVCVHAFNRGFGRIYQHHLMRLMRNSMWAKRHALGFSREELSRIRSIRAFDKAITAPVHGFSGVDDYYRRCSSLQFLQNIRKPTLIIQAEDDPFVPHACIPKSQDLSSSINLELNKHGGHVGFITGMNPQAWLPIRIASYLESMHWLI